MEKVECPHCHEQTEIFPEEMEFWEGIATGQCIWCEKEFEVQRHTWHSFEVI